MSYVLHSAFYILVLLRAASCVLCALVPITITIPITISTSKLEAPAGPNDRQAPPNRERRVFLPFPGPGLKRICIHMNPYPKI